MTEFASTLFPALMIVTAALAVALFRASRRLDGVERRLAELERRPQPAADTARPATTAQPTARPESAQPAVQAKRASVPPPPREAPPPPPQRSRIQFETLVGRRLPIWIGGTALVFAGFFLVRYTIELGVFGPVTRTTSAAIFALLLLAGSEVARRLPATASDPRIAQALAGAGIASAYGTLYVAAAIYHLIPPLAAFLVMLAITALALALALRHGPPTAAMALIGGFVAPLVAGFQAAGIGPLLLYLALFTGALFALARQRGWAWLAIATCAAGFGWVNFLLWMLDGRSAGGIGLLVLLIAVAGSLTLPPAKRAWLRAAPLVAGLVQLMVVAPVLDFGPVAWGLYCVLSAAALILALRDTRMMPGAFAALILILVLLAIGFGNPAPGVTAWAAIAATLLFGGIGLWRLENDRDWGWIATGGLGAPLLFANMLAPHLLPGFGWFLIDSALAGACGWLSWRAADHANRDDPALILGATFAAALGTLAVTAIAGSDTGPLALALTMAALSLWARRTGDTMLPRLATAAFAAACIAAALPIIDMLGLALRSVAGSRLPYRTLFDLGPLLLALAPPAIAAIAIAAYDRSALGKDRRFVLPVAILLALWCLYALAKQPLAIATPQAFERWGFLERALLTQACFAAGWWLTRRDMQSLGKALLALGAFRFLWFGLLLLNPTVVAQQVGGIPILNAVFVSGALTAFWLWTLPQWPRLRWAAAIVTGIAACALVRQAAHGSILTGPVTTAENWGYSAALLGLAIFWLWRGIAHGLSDMRHFGLGLLTLVTLKVFLIDAAALTGLLRILSFLALGLALIGIGWAYGRFVATTSEAPNQPLPNPDPLG
ncbi:putative membrane protein [Stakelama sediminis]|uniref:Putative membrane protein n=1 Tax=Stakelama sediminis TaxID=463200 RepID=A0A840Z1L7_9SPHN|nr:DUF2339 domain-containing protein [Stakelama sediminis]MBB5719606.1 putative membrane protein [Stakelama sediminis]